MMAAIFIQPTFAQNDEKLFSGKPILTGSAEISGW